MTAQQLRKSILQMAVQGKLVPQDPSDEPAHILLERIRAEKERLIKEKKIKKEKNPSVIYRGMDNLHYEKFADGTVKCIEDEIPFEIPESWGWGRLGELVYNHGQRRPSADFSYIDISSIDNQHQRLSCEENILSSEKAPSRARKIVAYGDILYSTVRPYLHNMCIIDRIFSKQPIASTGFAVLTCHDDFFNEFLFYYMMSPDFDTYVNHTDNAKGVAYPSISDTRLYHALIPIPPAREQRDIVSAVKRLIHYINKYNIARNQLNRLMSNFPNAMKHSILQWAVQGKLVQQDESDEPASVLLDRIRAKKKELIKDGKLKKDKHEAIIFRRDNSYYERLDDVERCIDDEIPFEIPHNWSWSRLGAVFTLQAGKNIPSSEISEEPHSDLYPCYGGNGIRGFVSKTNRSGKHPIIGRQGALCGNINMATGKFYATEHAICVDTYCNTHVPWGCLFLEALNFNQYATATAQPGLSVSKINEVLIPIPPLAEQRRIYHTFENCSSIMQSW